MRSGAAKYVVRTDAMFGAASDTDDETRRAAALEDALRQRSPAFDAERGDAAPLAFSASSLSPDKRVSVAREASREREKKKERERERGVFSSSPLFPSKTEPFSKKNKKTPATCLLCARTYAKKTWGLSLLSRKNNGAVRASE